MNVCEPLDQRIDPLWWNLPELQPVLARRDITGIYRFLRSRGFSQARIAGLSGQNQSEVSTILGLGRTVTAYDVLARIADGLDIPRGLMGLAYLAPVAVIRDGAQPTESRHMRRRAFMGVAAKITMGATLATTDLALLTTPAAAGPIPTQVGLSDVQRIEDMTAALDRQDLAFGGGSCREAIIGYLNWATSLRDAAMTDDVARALNTALAHLEELAGWASYDLLLLDSAEHFYLRSLHSAQFADYPFMAAKALARLGKIYLDEGQYGDALRMFQLATVPAREAGSARMTAYLHLHDALVYASQGKTTVVESAIRQGEDAYATITTDEPAHQKRFFNDCELLRHKGLAYSGLAEHDPAQAPLAVEATMTAVGRAAVNETRSLLLYRTTLALNTYRSGDTDQANHITSQIITALPAVSSRRLLARLRPLAAEAATHDSTATDLAHQLTTPSAGQSG